MKALSHRLAPAIAAVSLLALGSNAALAQSTRAGTGTTMFGLTGPYVGLNIGKSDLNAPCDITGLFSCDDADTTVKASFGGMFLPFLGVEASYIHFGDADRSGGTLSAKGANLSLVAKAPIGPIGIFGKVGTTYSDSDTSANVAANVPVGSASGWGRSYGAGVSWDFHPNWSVVGEWERHRVHFASGKSDVELTSVGVQYRF